MIPKLVGMLLPLLAILAAVAAAVALGALLRLLFGRMHRNMPALLAAAILLFMQDKLLHGALATMLFTVMNATPEGNAARPIILLIILVVYLFAGLAIPFLLAWIGASFVDRIKKKNAVAAEFGVLAQVQQNKS